jgi:Uma2 family endonuclease
MAAAFPLPLRPITFEQYEEFEAPDGFRDELINGRIVVSPEAKPLHHEIAANVFGLLKKAGRENPLRCATHESALPERQ